MYTHFVGTEPVGALAAILLNDGSSSQRHNLGHGILRDRANGVSQSGGGSEYLNHAGFAGKNYQSDFILVEFGRYFTVAMIGFPDMFAAPGTISSHEDWLAVGFLTHDKFYFFVFLLY